MSVTDMKFIEDKVEVKMRMEIGNENCVARKEAVCYSGACA